MNLKSVAAGLILAVLWPVASSAQSEGNEWIKVYFNMPPGIEIKEEEPPGNFSHDLIGTLESLIDSAQYSVDLCIYDLEHPRIAEALIRARKRGVRVRLVTDNFNRTDGGELDTYIWNTLGSAGIVSIDDDGDIYAAPGEIFDYKLVNAGADMHHKFAVIDHLSVDKNDDIVWTGSTNLTYTGAYNTNNVVVIKDAEIADVYVQEFDQMWGGPGDVPNPVTARFHKDKTDVNSHYFEVGGTPVEVYFSPMNRDRSKPSISERLVQLIEEEVQHDIRFQAFSITPGIPLSQAMWDASVSKGVILEGVIDPAFYSRYRNSGQIWGSALAKQENRMILPARETRKLHHKVLVLDATHPSESDTAIVVTGSYNFSNNAEFNNDENLLIIYSDEIAAQYKADFLGAMQRAKGEVEAPAPPVDPEKWYAIYTIRDGSHFEIEVYPGFGYPVRLLGVDVPTIYAAPDSAEYLAGPAADYLRNLLEGRMVRLKGFSGSEPDARRGAYRAYVQVDFDGEIISLNKRMLEKGFGMYSKYYRQHKDSVKTFQEIEQLARENRQGLWRYPSKAGSLVLRTKEVKKGDALDVVYPININTADQATLQLLPGIGAAYAKRIIEYRKQHGAFRSIEQLMEIKGIGEKRFQRLRPVITL